MVLRKQVDENRNRRVFIFGAGKVGATLAHALRASGAEVQLRAARRGIPRRQVVADLVILAVRDPSIADVARAFAKAGVLLSHAIVVHTAGALGPEVLESLSLHVAGVAQMHPLFSFASVVRDPHVLDGATVLTTGDACALRVVKQVARDLGARAVVVPKVDRVRYHAAAALLANGAATLAALSTSLMIEAGMPSVRVPQALAALLRSVANNLVTIGVPHLLTGPVRRGDLEAIKRQAHTLRGPALEAFRGLLAPQIELARQIGDAPSEALDAIAHWSLGPRPQR